MVGEEPDLPSLLDEWLRIGPEDDLGLSDALIAQLDPNLARLASFTTQFEHIARRNNERSEALSSRLQWLAGRIRTSERLVTVSSEGAPEQAVRALVNLHLATEQVSGPGRGILMLPEPARTGLVLQRPGLQAFLHTSLETEMLEGEEDVLLLPMASEHERPGGALVQSAGLRVQYAPQLLLAPGEALAPWEVLGDLTDAGWADVDDLRREEGLGFGWLERPCRDHDYEALPEGLARFA